MSLVYFTSVDGDTIVTMDSETDITFSRSNTSTKHSIFKNADISDGLIEGNVIITVTGVVTYSKTPRQSLRNPTPIEFQNLIDQVVRSQQRFTLYSSKAGHELLKDVSDCVITDQSISISRWSNSITATLTFESQFITDAARVTYLPPVPDNPSYTTEKGNGKGSTTGQSKEDAGRTLFKAGAEVGFSMADAISGIFSKQDGGQQ